MKIIYLVLSTAILFLGTSSEKPSSRQVYFYNYENVLGTSLTLKVAAQNESIASRAEEVALDEIDRLSGILSTYDPESEFSRWQKTQNSDVPVSPELFEVMSLFNEWQSKTGGALNPAIGTASDLWKKADETELVPAKNELSEAVAVMQKNHWTLNEEKMTARHLTNDPLVFNSFVKSYILKKASDEIMKTDGVSSALISIGGDILVAGEMTEEIGIADPKRFADNNDPFMTIRIEGKAVATSGNYKRGFMVGDEWYSHILDARTAIPANDIIAATVVSEDAVEAGAMATAFNILTPEESINLAKKVPGLEFLIITNDGKQIESEGWDKLEVKTENATNPTEAAADYEMTIEFEITRFQGRSPRPYIAVWIENEKDEPVRTLALWFNNYRWLPDLRRWYTKHYEKTQQYEYMQTVTSATRSAGKYTLSWDVNDENGKSVKPGKYTVYIEASREHGTYQLIKKEIELNRKAQQIDIEGGVEISSAAIKYNKLEKAKDSK